mmetsp:Transcript_52141/g.113734  ORF Transcript_52141/g.113734 Transcript_52141/m.113734 type:complete len:462 (-) Transcript_52141:60-1445(-)
MRLLQPCRRGSQLLRPFSLQNRIQFSLPASAGARHFSQKPSELSEKVAETLPTPDSPAKPPLEPVDTTTKMDMQQEDRFVERRIEDHVKEHGEQIPEAQDFQEAAQRLAEAPSAPVPLRLRDPNAVAEQQKDVIIRSRTTTGQVLWPATKEDIEILSQSDQLYPRPFQVEGSVIIRLVRLSDPVTSPVGRMVRNRQYGIRGNEKWQLLATGFVCMLMVFSLGAWQLRRMKWKRDLIEMRRERLAMPRLQVSGSPFPWKDQVPDYVYRVVEVRGVFDHDQEMHVGPRPGSDETGETTPGVLVVTPLRLEDGSTVLVNRGHLPSYRLDRATRKEVPTWVRVRGVLEEGEIPNLVGRYARLKNRPDKKQYLYLLADELAENANARNHEECAQALVTAIDVLYEDDFKAGYRRQLPFTMKHKEDYLLFWADEHTHFNYAMQWFGMGTLFMVMTFYKFVEVYRWRF